MNKLITILICILFLFIVLFTVPINENDDIPIIDEKDIFPEGKIIQDIKPWMLKK